MEKPFYLTEEYWSGLSELNKNLYGLVRPLPKATYTVDTRLMWIEEFIEGQTRDMTKMGGRFDLTPDYQRGHVWTDTQRSAFIESLLRHCAPCKILFNCPGWSNTLDNPGDIPNHTFECIDGLQRLTAVRKFVAGEITVFGGLKAQDLKGTAFDPKQYTLQLSVYGFTRRSELLRFYLDLNAGGTVHSQAELDRVRALYEEACCAADESAPQMESDKGY